MTLTYPASPSPPRTDRERNSARSREAILDAAEQLFAKRGYDATSLMEVGNLAGVSRATPGYFFGSKADLYFAVIERSFAGARTAVLEGRDRALASHEPPEAVLGGVIRDYFDFLSARSAFVKLMERAALDDGPEWSGTNPGREAGQEALAAIVEQLGFDAGRSREAAHLLISMIALCWFPMIHAETMAKSLGLDPNAPEFAEERKRHVVDLILHGVVGRLRAAQPSAAPTTKFSE